MFKLVIAVLVITCLAVHAASDVHSEWEKHKVKSRLMKIKFVTIRFN